MPIKVILITRMTTNDHKLFLFNDMNDIHVLVQEVTFIGYWV